MPTCRRTTLSALVRSWASEFEELFEQEESSAMDEVVIDEDGELIVPRRKTSRRCFGVKIQHNITSPIPNVGLQVLKYWCLQRRLMLHLVEQILQQTLCCHQAAGQQQGVNLEHN